MRFELDGSVHRQLKVMATEQDIPLTDLIVRILSRAASEYRPGNPVFR